MGRPGREDPSEGRSGEQQEPAESRGSATGRSQKATVALAVTRVARWSLRLLVILVAVAVCLYLLGRVWVVVLPTLLALLLSTVLWPVAHFLRRRLPDSAAAAAALVAGLVPLIGVAVVVATLVLDQVDELSDALVRSLEEVQDWTTGPPLNLEDDDLGGLIDRGTDELQERAEEVAGWALSGASVVGSSLLTLVLTLVLTFFFIKDGPRFLPWMRHWLPARTATHVAELSQRTWNVLGGFIRAQAGVGLADGVGIGLGLLLLGVPLALPLAVLTFVGAFIPIVGALATGLLAVLVAWVTEGTTTALLVAVLVIVVQQLESNLLSPLLMGKTLALHPALVILGVTAGGTLAGVAGAFMAVPVLAVATAVARYGHELVDADQPARAPEDGPPSGGEVDA